MTFFPDLGPYRYGFGPVGWDQNGPHSLEATELYWWMWDPKDGAFDLPELTVGWLEPPHDYARGEMSASLIEKLDHLCRASRYHVTRGFHPCGFCGDTSDGLGSKEIRVQGEGVVFASPNKIAHYVSAHGYAPPEEFVAALQSCSGLAEPKVGVQRPVSADMIPREDVSVVRLEAEISALLRKDHRDRVFPDMSIRDGGEIIEVNTRIDLRGLAEPVERSWQVPKAALLNTTQSVHCIIGMLEATHSELALPLFLRQHRSQT